MQSMHTDELLKKNSVIPPGSSGASYREGAVVFKLASKLEPEVCALLHSLPLVSLTTHAMQVESISIANNGLKYLSHFNTLSQYLPKLANLSLQHNRIEDFAELDK